MMTPTMEKIGWLLVFIGAWFLLRPEPEKRQFIGPDHASYQMDWSEQSGYSGLLRGFEAAGKATTLPMITHHALITTGEFSNPDIVKIRRTGEGSYYWSSQSRSHPKGTAIALHMIPSTPFILKLLNELEVDDVVKIVGQEESDGVIHGPNDRRWIYKHKKHKLFLVSNIEINK